MSFSFIYIFLCILFNCTKSQDSQDYRFYFILDNKNYDITIENSDIGNEFKERLIEKKEIKITMIYKESDEYAMKDYDDNFPKLTHYERVSSSFDGNEIVGCASSFIILTDPIDDADCNKLGSYNGTFGKYQNNENIDVTFKAEKIQKDDIPKDSGYIKKVAILISIITLILLYYLLLL